MIYKDISELIGKTPILSLPLKNTRCELFLKMEKFNPGQSMKDRMALNMINQAEKDGKLKPRGTIIESSSGNTAIGLAMISAARRYKFIAIVDHHASVEKIRMIQAYGGQIKIVGENCAEDEVAVMERERVAFELSQKIPNSFFPGQADNLANREGYITTLAQDIINDINNIDYLFGCIGTGGSLCGTAMGLKQKMPNLKIIAVEPEGSIIFGGEPKAYFQSGTGNPYGADIPKNIDYSLINENLYAKDIEAFTTCRFLAEKEGILIGGSAGGVLYKAIEFASKSKEYIKIVVVLPDGGEKYLSTIYNHDWLSKRNLFDPKIYKKLSEKVLCR